jgi:hypothetical protein
MPMTSTETGKSTVPPSRRRLGATLATSLVAVLVVVTALTAVALWRRHAEALSQGQRRAEILTEIVERHLAFRFKTLEATLYEVAAYDRLIGGPDASADEWFPVLHAAFSGLAGFTSLSVADANGTITYSTQPMTMRQPVSNGELHRRLSADPRNDALVFDRLFRDPIEGRVLLPIGRVLRTVNAEFEGMLIAFLAPAELAAPFADLDLGTAGVLRIFSATGQRLVPAPQYADPLDQPAPEFPLASIADGEGTSGMTLAPIEANGARYLTAYRTMAGTGLAIAVSFPEAMLLAGWWNEVLAAIAAVAIVGLALFLAAIAIARAARASSDSADRT